MFQFLRLSLCSLIKTQSEANLICLEQVGRQGAQGQSVSLHDILIIWLKMSPRDDSINE